MEKWLADKVTNWCTSRNQVSDVQEIAIRYGIELYFNSLLKIVLLICIGIVCNKGIETVIVIGCFCLLRGEAGGIHMQSSIGCFMSMFIMTFITVIGAERLPRVSLITIIIIFGVCMILAYHFVPYTTANNPIEDDNIIKRKKRNSLLIIFSYAIVASITQSSQLRILILLPVIIEIITILPIWKRKEA